jgi:hypothetical protein
VEGFKDFLTRVQAMAQVKLTHSLDAIKQILPNEKAFTEALARYNNSIAK